MADVTECNVVRRTAESLNKESLFSFNYILAPPPFFSHSRLDLWRLFLSYFFFNLSQVRTTFFDVYDSLLESLTTFHVACISWGNGMYQRAALGQVCKEKKDVLRIRQHLIFKQLYGSTTESR